MKRNEKSMSKFGTMRGPSLTAQKPLRHTNNSALLRIFISLALLSVAIHLSEWLTGPLSALFGTTRQRALHEAFLNGTIQPHPFAPWPKQRLLPCFPTSTKWTSTRELKLHGIQRGLLFLKPFKTGSSTSAGIHLRIARNIADRKGLASSNQTCEAHFDHGPQPNPAYYLYSNRRNEESFLWTIIREPSERIISAFFHFQVSRKGVQPTVDNFKEYLVRKRNRDYYLTSLHPFLRYDRDKHNPFQSANEILRSFDFIGITERLDESAVALMMLLDLRMADILYIPAKSNGGYDAGGAQKCTYIKPKSVTPAMRDLVESELWQEQVKNDRLLYESANRSLDLTIDSLGRERFLNELNRYNEARKYIQHKCFPQVVYPCGYNGTFILDEETDCLWKDSGCGTTCLDEVATELNLW